MAQETFPISKRFVEKLNDKFAEQFDFCPDCERHPGTGHERDCEFARALIELGIKTREEARIKPDHIRF